jgi:tetratricopeptide (TPR) repeat protein/transglutaminase-like putative cysteine protease
MPRTLTAALALFLFSLPTQAADEWPVGRGPSREPDPYKLDPKALAAIPKSLIDDNVAVVVYAGSTYRVEADGTIETTTHEITRLGGRKAIEKLGEFRNISFTPAFQKLTLHAARIHKPGGKVVEVEPRHVQLRDVPTDFSTYDTDKQLIISFPALEVGDAIEVKWTVRGKNPEHDGHFFQKYSFGDPLYPVLLDEAKIVLAKGKTLKYSVREGLTRVKPAARQSKLDGYAYYRWSAKDCPRPPQDESLPSREEMRTVLMASTFPSWEAVGKWKHELRKECWKCTEAVRKTALEVTKGLKTPLEKARALTYHVRRNVRYLATGEKHDYTPHPPEAVLAARFGDCKDGAQLLAVMLKEVGIPVELVTLGAGDDGQIEESVPSPWGTHAILAVTIGGKIHWIDTTTRLNGWDELPRDDLSRLCYLTDDKGKVRIVRTPAATPEMTRTETTTDVRLDADGGMRCKRAQTYFGLAAVSQRDKYGEAPMGDRRRAITAALQDSYSRARLLSLNVPEDGLKNHDLPVRIETEFEVPKHFTGTAEKEGSLADSATWSRLLSYNIDHSRESAMVLPGPFTSTHTYRVHLPPGWEWDGMPKSKEAKSKWGLFRLTVVQPTDGGPLTLKIETRLERARAELSELDAYREWYDEVQKSYRVWLTMRPGTGAKAREELEALLAVSPQNAAAAKTLAKSYMNAGRYAHAWRVLDRACHYMPDDISLWELRVEAAESPAREEQARRDLMKRRPDELKHTLGLASALISQGKQEDARKLLDVVIEKGTAAEKGKAQYQYARSHYRRDQMKEALARLDLAEKADPDMARDLRAMRLRGQVLEDSGRAAEALVVLRKTLARDGSNKDLLLSMIRTARLAKDEASSLEFLRRYAALAEGDASALALTAEKYYDMGRLDDANEMAMRSREVTFHEKAQRILGLVAYKRGDYAKAAMHLEKAEPDSLVLAALLRALVFGGELAKAPGVLDQIDRLPSVPNVLKRMADEVRATLDRRKELGKRSKAPGLEAAASAEYSLRAGEPAVRVAKLAKGSDPLSVAVRARLALGRGQLREAAMLAEESLKGWPGLDLALLVRGRVRLEQEKPGAAEDLSAGMAWTRRKDADALRWLAEALEREGKLPEAAKAAREALALRPKDKALSALVERIEKRAKPGA